MNLLACFFLFTTVSHMFFPRYHKLFQYSLIHARWMETSFIIKIINTFKSQFQQLHNLDGYLQWNYCDEVLSLFRLLSSTLLLSSVCWFRYPPGNFELNPLFNLQGLDCSCSTSHVQGHLILILYCYWMLFLPSSYLH